MTAINIHTTVSMNSLPYLMYMRENMRSLASGKRDLLFHAHCIDAGAHSVLQKLEDETAFSSVIAAYGTSGSGAHAVAAMSALRKTRETAGIVDIIADSDTVVLDPDWDETVVSFLSRYGVIGTTAEQIGGFSSGNDKRQLCKGVPNIAWFAMSKRFDFSELDLTPQKHVPIPITSEELSKLYGLPIGYEVLCDVGWQIPRFLADRNIPHLGFHHAKPTKDAKAITSGNDYHEEYQLPDGTPFVAHQRGSMKHPFRGNAISSGFYDAVDAYVSRSS